MSARDDLRSRFSDFSATPFPRGGLPPDLRGDVALYDAEIAGLVSAILAGSEVEEERVVRDETLERKVATSVGGEDTVWRAYLAELAALVELARRAAAEG